MKSENLIHLIKKGKQDKALQVLYKNFPAFKNSFVKSGGNVDDAQDIFQEALLIVVNKIKNDQHFNLSCTINTFLFGVCKNLGNEFFRHKGKESKLFIDKDVEQGFESEIINDFKSNEEKYKELDDLLFSIGEKCMRILKLFYVSKLNMKEVAEELNFKSETSAKTQKYKCIEKAKNLAQNII